MALADGMAMTLDVGLGATVGSGDVTADVHAARSRTKQIENRAGLRGLTVQRAKRPEPCPHRVLRTAFRVSAMISTIASGSSTQVR